MIPSAHEVLKTDAHGDHHYLGFVLTVGDICLYHSGDCVPYNGLVERLHGAPIDVALLPVNGRDANRTSKGILGNFTFDEAVTLCRDAEIPWLIPHHVGMFAFNTLDDETLARNI